MFIAVNYYCNFYYINTHKAPVGHLSGSDKIKSYTKSTSNKFYSARTTKCVKIMTIFNIILHLFIMNEKYRIEKTIILSFSKSSFDRLNYWLEI